MEGEKQQHMCHTLIHHIHNQNKIYEVGQGPEYPLWKRPKKNGSQVLKECSIPP